MKSAADLDKHIIDDCVYDFLAPLNAENVCIWLNFFGTDKDDDDEDWAEESMDELLDSVREVYLKIYPFLGIFATVETEEDDAMAINTDGFFKLANFFNLGYSDELLGNMFSKL